MRKYLVKMACLVGVAATFACSWARFDDFEKDTPVIMVSRPAGVVGFGSTLSAMVGDQSSWIVVGSGPGGSAVRYDLSGSSGTGLAPEVPWLCGDGEGDCVLAERPTVLSSLSLPLSDGQAIPGPCFAAGLGASEGEAVGVRVWCEGDSWYSIPLPEESSNTTIEPLRTELGTLSLVLASERSAGRSMLASIPSLPVAWVYDAQLGESFALPPPLEVDDGWGGTLAIVAGESRTLFVLGSPAAGRLHFFELSPEGAAEEVLCLRGPSGYGRALVAEQFDGDGTDDLAVAAEDGGVEILDGSELLAAANGRDADCLDGRELSVLLTTVECGVAEHKDLASCAKSDFGFALAAADMDGDGTAELAVSAPSMRVRGTVAAGAVLVYRVDSPNEPAAVHYLARNQKDDHLGMALSIVAVQQASVVAAAVPRRGALALFFCSELTPEARRFGRCK